MVSFVIPTSVELLDAIGVGSHWVHPISSNFVLITSAYLMLINKAPISASVAEDITCFRIDAISNSVPLCMFGLLESD